MTRKPTIKDVARLAGVGPMTVSRLLNQSAQVSEDAAARIYNAIEKLGYRPNEMARALRGQKLHTIGIIVPYLHDPFFALLAQAITTVARERDYSVILTTSNDEAGTEYVEAQLMVSHNANGLIVIPATEGPSRLSLPEFSDTHIVAVDRPLRDRRRCSVLVENRSGVERAVEHLISAHGHKRIAFASLNDRFYTFRERFEGYSTAMRHAKLNPLPLLHCPTQQLASIALLNALRSPNPPTALFSANSLTTHYALKALLDSDIRIPEDIALVAFDDFDMADVLEPRVSVIRQPAQQLGEVAANLLFDLMDGSGARQRTRLVLPVDWVPRNSCGCGVSTRIKATGTSTPKKPDLRLLKSRR